jgi:hypothetical protein
MMLSWETLPPIVHPLPKTGAHTETPTSSPATVTSTSMSNDANDMDRTSFGTLDRVHVVRLSLVSVLMKSRLVHYSCFEGSSAFPSS